MSQFFIYFVTFQKKARKVSKIIYVKESNEKTKF